MARHAVNLEPAEAHDAFVDDYIAKLRVGLATGLSYSRGSGRAWAVTLDDTPVGVAGITRHEDGREWRARVAVPSDLRPGLWDQAIEAVRQEFLTHPPLDSYPLVVRCSPYANIASRIRQCYIHVEEIHNTDETVSYVLARADAEVPDVPPGLEIPTPVPVPAPAPELALEYRPVITDGVAWLPVALLAALRPRSSWSGVVGEAAIKQETACEGLRALELPAKWSAIAMSPWDIKSALTLAVACSCAELELQIAPGFQIPDLVINTCKSSLTRLSFTLKGDHALDLKIRGIVALVVSGGKKLDLQIMDDAAEDAQPPHVRLLTTCTSMIVVPARWEFRDMDGKPRGAPMGFMYAKDGFDGRAVAPAERETLADQVLSAVL